MEEPRSLPEGQRQGHFGHRVVCMHNSLHQSDAKLTSSAFARGDCKEDLQGDAVIWRVKSTLNMVIYTSRMAIAKNCICSQQTCLCEAASESFLRHSSACTATPCLDQKLGCADFWLHGSARHAGTHTLCSIASV